MTQFVAPDDEHDVLETCRELQIKINTQKGICASRWSFTKNHYVIHGQQNVKNVEGIIISIYREMLNTFAHINKVQRH